MHILIVDDEHLARQRLIGLLDEMDEQYQLAGEAANGREAIEFCQQQDVDLVLMDIQMPKMDGLEAAKLLAQLPLPPAVVFTTAYSEHALSAFDVNAVDYLLKPVRREKLQLALDKAPRLSRVQVAQQQEQETFLVSHHGGATERVMLADIVYFRADSKYVVARHEAGELLLEEPLKSLEQRLGNRFLRIHRNALVAKERIRSVKKGVGDRVLLGFTCIEDELEISRRHLVNVRKAMKSANR